MSDLFIGGGGGSKPGGASGDIQFNNAGVLGGETLVPLAHGGTNADLSASGSATAVLAQDASHIITARALVANDIPTLDAAKIGTGTLTLARGGTNADLSATGGASNFLKQASTGAAITVAQPAMPDLLSGMVSPDGYMLPRETWNTSTNVNLAGAAQNAMYVVKIHLPVPISFTKASIYQSSGATTGTNIYVVVYSLAGTKLTQCKFASGSGGGSLAGAVTGSLTLPSGGYFYGMGIDTAGIANTVSGTDTASNFVNLRNTNVTSCGFQTNVISGGNAGDITSLTPNAGGHMSSNSLVCLYLEP